MKVKIEYVNGFTQIKDVVSQSEYDKACEEHWSSSKIKEHFGESFITDNSPIYIAAITGVVSTKQGEYPAKVTIL